MERTTPTLHIITVHHRSAYWIDIQNAYFKQYIDMPYKVYAILNGGLKVEGHEEKFHEVYGEADGIGKRAGRSHSRSLDRLSDRVVRVAADEDLVLFIDSDCFPIAPLSEFMLGALEENEAGAVQRWENSGERTPHPSFFFTKVGTWKRWGRPSWGAAGYCVTSMKRRGVRNDATDVGARLLWMFDRDRIRLLQMRRSNTMNIHPVMFGVYENICYHHGAGSRPGKQTREDLVHDPVQRRWVTQDGVAEENREKDRSVRAMIKKDFNFWMKFVEKPSKNPQKHIKKLKE